MLITIGVLNKFNVAKMQKDAILKTIWIFALLLSLAFFVSLKYSMFASIQISVINAIKVYVEVSIARIIVATKKTPVIDRFKILLKIKMR